ncbi:hypothetical protein ACH4TX_42250 [Streptomyces sp. NPDC021098]|uniref:hypothetical protein n=1 Tax=unclassified Streptomyces TaxID=2593676 RepID=UPI0037ADD336
MKKLIRRAWAALVSHVRATTRKVAAELPAQLVVTVVADAAVSGNPFRLLAAALLLVMALLLRR